MSIVYYIYSLIKSVAMYAKGIFTGSTRKHNFGASDVISSINIDSGDSIIRPHPIDPGLSDPNCMLDQSGFFYNHIWKPLYNYALYVCGFFAGVWTDIRPLVYVVFLAILLDVVSAVKLARRMKAKGITSKDGRYCASGKFSSFKFAKIFNHMLVALVSISFAYFVQQHVLMGLQLYIVNGVCVALIFRYVISILENNSTCNDSKWAVIAQKLIIDKAERHLDIDLDVVRDMIHLEDDIEEIKGEKTESKNIMKSESHDEEIKNTDV